MEVAINIEFVLSSCGPIEPNPMLMPAAWSTAPHPLNLPDGEIHLWIRSLDVPSLDLVRVEQNLSPDERERAHRYRTGSSRRNFVTCRDTLRRLLTRYLNTAPDKLQFEYSHYGKPAISPSHLDGRKLEFNLSHVRDLGLFAFSRSTPIGVDIEAEDPDINFQEVMPLVFSPREREILSSCPPDQFIHGFYSLWTAKEALVKALGTGLSIPLHQLNVLADNGALTDRLDLRVGDALPKPCHLYPLPAPENYQATVALAADSLENPPPICLYLYNEGS